MRSALHRWLATALLVLVPVASWAGIPKNNKPGDFWDDQWKAAEMYMLPPHIWSIIIAILAVIGTVAFVVWSYKRPKAVASPTAPDWTPEHAKKVVGWTLFGFLAVYALGFNGNFSVYDDPQNIWLNDPVTERTWDSLYEVIWDNHRKVNQEWMFLSLFGSFQLFGKQYWGFFLSNWLMVPLLLGLVYRLGHELFDNRRVAWLGMVFMGFSPILAELVCWMLTRGHYFGLTFALASCTTYLAYMRTEQSRHKVVLYLMAAAFYASCQFGKPIFIYVPLWLCFFDVFRRRRVEWVTWGTVALGVGLLVLDLVAMRPLVGALMASLQPSLEGAFLPTEAVVVGEDDSYVTSAIAVARLGEVVGIGLRLAIAAGLGWAAVQIARRQEALRSVFSKESYVPLFVADKALFFVLMAIFLRKIIDGGASKGRVNDEFIGGSFLNTLALNANHVLSYMHSSFVPMPTGLRTPWNEPASWLYVTGIPDILVNGFSPLASLVILLCLATCGLVLALRWRWGMLLLAGVGAVISVGPVANIPVHTVVHAYRYTLSMNVLISITLGAACIHIVANTRKEWIRNTVLVLTVGWLALGAYHTIGNIRAWRHPVDLWTRSADVLYPNDGWSHYYAGKTLQHKRRYHEALAHEQIAIVRIPNNTMANRRIGDAYYELDDYPHAAEFWEKYFKSHKRKITSSYAKKLARVGLADLVPRKYREDIAPILEEMAEEGDALITPNLPGLRGLRLPGRAADPGADSGVDSGADSGAAQEGEEE